MRTFKSDLVPPPPFSILWPDRNQWPLRAFEIGGGTGEFAHYYSSMNPNCFLVSVERTKNKSDVLLEKNDVEIPNNLFFLRADAISTVTHCVPDRSLDRIFILYPNPYPKHKQANQRWHNMPFMHLLSKKLKADGVLQLRTNIKSYADEARKKMTANFGFRLIADQIITHENETHSAFERKYLSRKEKCFLLEFSCR